MARNSMTTDSVVTGRRTVHALGVVFMLCVCSEMAATAADRYQRERDALVQRDIISAGINNPRVIEAIRRTPRHEFVPPSQRANAYFDMALPIGAGQTISPPYVVAFMTQMLDPQPTDRVLEIGTGSGYQAAVLSHVVQEVYSVEIVESLGNRAARTLQRLGYENVHTRIGDGYQGWSEHAPFDKIIVTCSPENVPQPLIDQLAEGGRIVVPLGSRFDQRLYLLVKEQGELRREALEATFFVPMTGTAEAHRDKQINERIPRLRDTSFEELFPGSDRQPDGWYYVRQGQVVDDPAAPDGKRVLQFENRTPGRMAHAVQSFGVDGRFVDQLELQVMVRARGAARGRHPDESAGVFVEFYNATRASVGQVRLGPWNGTYSWREEQRNISVPSNARLGVVAVGLFGGTGVAAFDKILLQVSRLHDE